MNNTKDEENVKAKWAQKKSQKKFLGKILEIKKVSNRKKFLEKIGQ